MKEEIKKGFGFGVGFVLAKGLVNGIAGVLVKKLEESETNNSTRKLKYVSTVVVERKIPLKRKSLNGLFYFLENRK